ncbi:DUF2948 family protein [Jannaschia donghaensis]|uniref:DUF2948 domain-containing protein n=1 Tax=Jannaschia donghaensis TaxID=420998 RepID=A0A0M6YPG2_9RHOB|nr:DUF2948 family protein [Jannaschia donghaensis]CTQ51423.1 hypothetical protein JDO7802_03462 [Jannaschia donghaensis]
MADPSNKPVGDARFHDADGVPLRLWATDAEDLQVVSALVQDAVLSASEMRWQKGGRRFAMLLNRFRWEHGARQPERVQTVLTANDVRAVRGQGVVPGDADTVLSVLMVDWVPGEDADGTLRLTFAGDGLIEVTCDCLDLTLGDVTRPYAAPSGKAPTHPDA